jgi:hypothetical protein
MAAKPQNARSDKRHAARSKRTTRAGIGQLSPYDVTITDTSCPGGSISICATATDDFTYTVQIFTDDPAHGGTPTTVSAIEMSLTGDGKQCAVLPAGTWGPTRYAVFSNENTGSTETKSFPNPCVAHAVAGTHNAVAGCQNCQKPAPVALSLQLDTRLQDGSSNVTDAMTRPVPLLHSQHRSYPCCWFSPPLDAADAGGNPAYWMLQKTANDTWSLILRRVSHELAKYHLKSKDSHRFPIKLKRVSVSKDFKNWPATITIRAAK